VLSELFGGAGDDVLFDGSVSSTLQGSAGSDQYWIDGTQAGSDHILDIDGHGQIDWELADGSSPILSGGGAGPGGSVWQSADGSIFRTQQRSKTTVWPRRDFLTAVRNGRRHTSCVRPRSMRVVLKACSTLDAWHWRGTPFTVVDVGSLTWQEADQSEFVASV
jgi:hypothetical protein